MLSVLLVILFTVFDLGLAVMRQTSLTEGSRRLARAAAVRGSKASGAMPSWGPANVSTTAADSTFASVLAPVLVGMDPSHVHVTVDWPDTGNVPNDRVHVTLTCSHQPMIPFVMGSSSITLTAESTLRIAH